MTYDYNSKIYLAGGGTQCKGLSWSDGDGLLHTDCWTWNPNQNGKGSCFRSWKQAFGPSDSDQS